MLLKSICIVLLLTAISQTTLAKVNKVCIKKVQVDAVCAGEGDNHPEDPIFDPVFVYYSAKSYALIKKLERDGMSLKDEPAVCETGSGYLIYDLFGKNRLPDSAINFDRVSVDFVFECKE